MVSTLNSGPSGPGSSPSQGYCVVTRHLILTMPLSTQEYNKLDNGDKMPGGNLQCTSIPSRSLVASYYRNWDKLQQLWATRLVKNLPTIL